MNYIFETQHLRVRRFEKSDAEGLYRNHLEKEIKQWIPNESYADLEETQEVISFYGDCVDKGQLPYVLAIELKETGKLIGDTGVNEVEDAPGEVEIGYSICEKYSGRGFATEVVLAMTDFVVSNFDVKVLYGRVMHGNNASVRIMEKCGFEFVREEFGAEDDPYGKGMLVYRKVHKKVLLTAFLGTSAEWLVQGNQYRLLLLPNDKVRDSELLIEMLSKESFDYVVSFGQRPNIKNKVHIETTAKAGVLCMDTGFDCGRLQNIFEQKGIDARISGNAGTSFCNQIYFNGLKYIGQGGLNAQMVFVHVPFLKNVDNFEEFREKVFEVIDELKCK